MAVKGFSQGRRQPRRLPCRSLALADSVNRLNKAYIQSIRRLDVHNALNTYIQWKSCYLGINYQGGTRYLGRQVTRITFCIVIIQRRIVSSNLMLAWHQAALDTSLLGRKVQHMISLPLKAILNHSIIEWSIVHDDIDNSQGLNNRTSYRNPVP